MQFNRFELGGSVQQMVQTYQVFQEQQQTQLERQSTDQSIISPKIAFPINSQPLIHSSKTSYTSSTIEKIKQSIDQLSQLNALISLRLNQASNKFESFNDLNKQDLKQKSICQPQGKVTLNNLTTTTTSDNLKQNQNIENINQFIAIKMKKRSCSKSLSKLKQEIFSQDSKLQDYIKFLKTDCFTDKQHLPSNNYAKLGIMDAPLEIKNNTQPNQQQKDQQQQIIEIFKVPHPKYKMQMLPSLQIDRNIQNKKYKKYLEKLSKRVRKYIYQTKE